MITELTKSQLYKVQHLTDACKNIECRAIVNGINPGRVYADDPAEPAAALIWIQGQQGFQLIGDAQSPVFAWNLEEYIRTRIEPELRGQDIHWVEIGADKAWEHTLRQIFRSRNLSADDQHVFTLGEIRGPVELPEDRVTIRKIDAALLKSGRLENHSFLEEKILHFWDSADSFLHRGLGYLAEHDNQAVSLAFSAFAAGRTHAIDIETLEEYRRNNYGTAVAAALLQEFRVQGIEPYWDCTPENTGSIRIAEAIGMVHDFDYRIFWYRF
ncbi:GNAT family N-acetyltransferase [Paenibacillus sp. MMS20-IR301]|uniref:GNAT family N-acetyltransferase n=1 Tax=Paenibacillus sp. MMS20-IR301 TaxID=2895946 RepID=UPI0028ED39AA|nr:GNAT family N-acetyltransferase [Paenibacillus sp. MMS20-IR301]WNS42891.1 GNAT family N-acetyltransferase [Paenibacillus sp. MMS20-IR301]